jgi:pimeloyl-ACP methyl ester carboxylesterase
MRNKAAVIIETRKGKIEFSRNGEGSPILYLHGSLSNCNENIGLDPLIDAGYSIIVPSRPGYGKTPLNSGISAEQASDLMNELLECLNINIADVIAVSGGGLTGLYFASKYPGKVRKLLLESAVSKPLKFAWKLMN